MICELILFVLFECLSGDLESILSGDRKRRQVEQNSSDSSSLYYISLRGADSAGNAGGWSNVLSASYLNPASFSDPVSYFSSTNTTNASAEFEVQ